MIRILAFAVSLTVLCPIALYPTLSTAADIPQKRVVKTSKKKPKLLCTEIGQPCTIGVTDCCGVSTCGGVPATCL